MNPGSVPLFIMLYVLFIFLEGLIICALNHRNPNRKKEIYLKDNIDHKINLIHVGKS